MTRKSHSATTALYAGSFDPFTRGHQDIVERALRIFDRVVVAVGVNVAKTAPSELQERLRPIAALYAGDERVTVTHYSGLTAELARQMGATVLLRGVRGAADLEAEQALAEINRRLTGIDTVLLPCRPELAHVSSSAVRELQRFGADTAGYLPLSETNNHPE